MKQSEPQLKPCPFCGGEAAIAEFQHHGNMTACVIQCHNGGCLAAATFCFVCEVSGIAPDDELVRAESIRLWNRRI